MNKIIGGAMAGVLFVGGLVLWLGIASFQWPWRVIPEFGEVSVSVELPEEARIVGIEQIALDCRARIFAEVPVEGLREHSIFGKVYRTDKVTMTAKGDVDTCVEGTSAQVRYLRDGSTEVIIPGDSIVFVRPRVDAVATADSVAVSKGYVGRLTDVFPWVDTDLGLTPLAYAYAQNVIGSSECMSAAYAVTEQILIDAYTEQFVESGADPSNLTVRIEGTPNFPTPPALDMGDMDVNVNQEGIACVVSEDTGGVTILQ